MNCCRETTKMGVPPGNRPAVPRDWFRGVPERYVAGADTRGRQAFRLGEKDGHIIRARCAPLSPASGFPVSWSQQVIHEISGLKFTHYGKLT